MKIFLNKHILQSIKYKNIKNGSFWFTFWRAADVSTGAMQFYQAFLFVNSSFFHFLQLSLTILLYIQFFHMLPTLNLNGKNRERRLYKVWKDWLLVLMLIFKDKNYKEIRKPETLINITYIMILMLKNNAEVCTLVSFRPYVRWWICDWSKIRLTQ